MIKVTPSILGLPTIAATARGVQRVARHVTTILGVRVVCRRCGDVEVSTAYERLRVQEKSSALAAVLVKGVHCAISYAFTSLLEHASQVASTLGASIWECYWLSIILKVDAHPVTKSVCS